MTKFTPGPWLAEKASDTDETWGVKAHAAQALFIAECFSQGVGQDNIAANARLIAAAPDLYAACQQLTDWYVDMVNSGDCGFWNPEDEAPVKNARAAIAKARGEP